MSWCCRPGGPSTLPESRGEKNQRPNPSKGGPALRNTKDVEKISWSPISSRKAHGCDAKGRTRLQHETINLGCVDLKTRPGKGHTISSTKREDEGGEESRAGRPKRDHFHNTEKELHSGGGGPTVSGMRRVLT